MSYISTILQEYVNNCHFHNILINKHSDFYKKHNINIFSEFTKDDFINDNLNQIGGSVFETNLSNIKYSFEYYKAKSQDGFTKAIIIKKLNDKENITNNTEYYQSKHCALLLYDDNNLLKLAFLNMKTDCYKSEEKEKKGSILLKLIILWAKKNNFKKIILSDQAMYECKDNNYGVRYEIKYLHTLTHGKTWYSKYGFQFVDQVEQNNENYNKQILDNLKTENYPLELLVRILMREIVGKINYKIYSEYNYLEAINQIIQIYDECKIKPFYKFIKIISREYCFITSLIYQQIFDSLKLKKYESSEMQLILN